MIIILIYLKRTSARHHIAIPGFASWHRGSSPHRDMAHRDVVRRLIENDYHLAETQFGLNCSTNSVKQIAELFSRLFGFGLQLNAFVVWGRES